MGAVPAILRAKEISDEWADHSLPTEFVIAELRPREFRPKTLFRLCRLTTQLAGEAIQLSEMPIRQPPPPAPPLKGRGVQAACFIADAQAPPLQGRGWGGVVPQPTEPSNEIPNSFCASTANSIGSCCSTSLAKPFTINETALS